MTVGFRIAKRIRLVSTDMVTAFRAIPVANVSDCMSRMSAGGCRLRPLHAGGVMAGPALTVRTRPGDNLMLHKAIDMAESGDVIWSFDTNRAFDTVNGVEARGGSIDGPGTVIAGGMVFVTAGNGGFVGTPGNVLLAFEVTE